MALQERVVNFPVLGTNQIPPRLAQPYGRLIDAVDCEVERFGGADGSIQVAPRPAMPAVPTNSWYDTDGTLQSSDFLSVYGSAVYMTRTEGLPVVVVQSGDMFVLGASGKWTRRNVGAIVNAPLLAIAYAKSAVIAPDMAQAGDGSGALYVWHDPVANIGKYMSIDASGAVVSVGTLTNCRHPRVVVGPAFGTYQYLVAGVDASTGRDLHMFSFGTAGAPGNAGTVTSFLADANCAWDIAWAGPTVGLVAFTAADVTLGDIKMAGMTTSGVLTTGNITTADGAQCVISALYNADASPTNRVALAYGAFASGNTTVHTEAYDITLATATLTATLVFANGTVTPNGQVSIVSGVAGPGISGSAMPAKIAAGVPNNSFGGLFCTTYFFDAASGAIANTVFGIMPVTRAARVLLNGGNAYRNMGMFVYPSARGNTLAGTTGSQNGIAVDYLYDIDTGTLAGVTNSGRAGGDWTWNYTQVTNRSFPGAASVASICQVSAPLVTALEVQEAAQNVETKTEFFTIVSTHKTYALGAYSLSATAGSAIELADRTILPGPLPVYVTKTETTPAGIEHAAEGPTSMTETTASSSFLAGDVRSYVIVFERTASDGTVMRSDSSIAVSHTWTSGKVLQLEIPTLRTTLHDDVRISIYRTRYVNGQSDRTHRKITDDSAPLMNDPAASTVTFNDDVPDASALYNEVLYGGTGADPEAAGGGDGPLVSSDMMHGFGFGTYTADRAAVIADDGMLYFTPPRDSTMGVWWSDFLFTDGLGAVNLNQMDGRLVGGTSRGVYALDSSQLPDGTGTGAIPTAAFLPQAFTPTGASASCLPGVVMMADDGRAWLVDRGLNQEPFSLPADDYVSGEVIARMVRTSRYLICGGTTDHAYSVLYDWIARQWVKWLIPFQFAIESGGLLYFVTNSGQNIVAQSNTSATDYDTSPVSPTVTIGDVSFADIQGCQMVWGYLVDTEYRSPHTLSISVAADDGAPETLTFTTSGEDSGSRQRIWARPRQMESSSVKITVSMTPTDTTPGLCALLGIGASLGVLPTMRAPGTRRIATG
jgi:hypothetical protein